MTLEEIRGYPYDPRLILGVAADAGDREVKSAWKKAGAPDSGPVAEAYLMLRDEQARLRTALLSPSSYPSATEAARSLRRRPCYVGPGEWFEAIRRR